MWLLVLLAIVAFMMSMAPHWLGNLPVQGFVLQFYVSITVVISIFYHVLIIDPIGMAVFALLVVYYGTSRAHKSYPGSYNPTIFGLNPDGFCPASNLIKKGCADYFGAFDVRGAENIKNPDGQYMIAIHPHGPTAFSRMHFVSGFRDLLSRPSRMVAATVLFYLPIIREFSLWFGAMDAG